MRTFRRVLYVLVALAVLAVLAANIGPNGVGCGTVVIHARGRLIDAATDAPIANAVVVSFPAASEATNPERIADAEAQADNVERYAREATAAGREPRTPSSYYWNPCPRTRTDAEGRFHLYFTQGVSTSNHGFFGAHHEEPSQGDGLEALRVRLSPSGEVRVMLIARDRGTWAHTPKREFDDPWAEWDLGDVRVPPPSAGR